MSTMKTMSGDDNKSDMQGRHGDLTSAYKSSYARHSGGALDDTQQSAAGVGLGGSNSNDSLTTGSYNSSDDPDNMSGYGKGIAGELPMVGGSDGDDTSDSNRTAGGRPVG